MTRALLFLSIVICGCADAPTRTTVDGAGYYLVSVGGMKTIGTPSIELGPGFGLSIVEQRVVEGQLRGRTARGHWVPMDKLTRARPSTFSGALLADGALDVAWIVPSLTRVRITGDDGDRVRTDRGVVPAASLARPRRTPRPDGIGANERWIDVELASNTLVAYEGDRAVFATLVSTGVGTPGSPIATPRGLHRIKAKLPTMDMDNREHTGVVPYSYEAVPHVQVFEGSKALHGTLWHARFGHPASHGCINLSPADAERLYAFTAVGTPLNIR
jgi:hypothetical protein